jgi:hypothetical protein
MLVIVHYKIESYSVLCEINTFTIHYEIDTCYRPLWDWNILLSTMRLIIAIGHYKIESYSVLCEINTFYHTLWDWYLLPSTMRLKYIAVHYESDNCYRPLWYWYLLFSTMGLKPIAVICESNAFLLTIMKMIHDTVYYEIETYCYCCPLRD